MHSLATLIRRLVNGKYLLFRFGYAEQFGNAMNRDGDQLAGIALEVHQLGQGRFQDESLINIGADKPRHFA